MSENLPTMKNIEVVPMWVRKETSGSLYSGGVARVHICFDERFRAPRFSRRFIFAGRDLSLKAFGEESPLTTRVWSEVMKSQPEDYVSWTRHRHAKGDLNHHGLWIRKFQVGLSLEEGQSSSPAWIFRNFRESDPPDFTGRLMVTFTRPIFQTYSEYEMRGEVGNPLSDEVFIPRLCGRWMKGSGTFAHWVTLESVFRKAPHILKELHERAAGELGSWTESLEIKLYFTAVE